MNNQKKFDTVETDASQLDDVEMPRGETIEFSDELRAELFESENKYVPAHANFWSISLTLLEPNIQMVINLSGDLMIGRLGEDTPPTGMFLDLGPYNAHKKGVSRQHAVLLLQDKHVSIRARETTNHTYLNGKRLIPDDDYPLKPGDIISLGNLELKFSLIFDPFAI